MDADAIIEEVRGFFGDTTRSQEETLEGLERIRDAAEDGAQCLREDLGV